MDSQINSPIIPQPNQMTIVRESTNSPMIIVLTILLTLSFAANAFFGYQFVQLSKNSNQSQTLENTQPNELSESPTQTAKATPVVNTTTKPTAEPQNVLKVYSNAAFGFKFQIPKSMTQKQEMNDEYNRLVLFENGDNGIEVRLHSRPDLKSFDPKTYFHMDMPMSQETTLGGEVAGIYEAPNGYCDGPGCSKPYVSVVTMKNGDIYALSFLGHSKLTDADKVVIKSFTFQ